MGILEFGLLALTGLLIFIVSGIIAAEMDSALMSVATFVIGLITLSWGFGIPLWATFTANPLLIVGAALVYVAVGAAYTAIWKWPDFIRKNKESIMRSYNDWAHMNQNSDNSFDAYLESHEYDYNAKDHKERLGTWVGMWPFSFVWDVTRRPAMWLWKITYASLGDAFQNIGKRTARKIHEKNE